MVDAETERIGYLVTDDRVELIELIKLGVYSELRASSRYRDRGSVMTYVDVDTEASVEGFFVGSDDMLDLLLGRCRVCSMCGM